MIRDGLCIVYGFSASFLHIGFTFEAQIAVVGEKADEFLEKRV